MDLSTDRAQLDAWDQNPTADGLIALCNNLARQHEKVGTPIDRDIAIAIGQRAERGFPGQFEVLLAAGRLQLAAGMLRDALRPLIEAARIASEPRALRLLGEVFLRLGDARHAAMSFDRALVRNDDPETRGWLESARGYMPLQEQHGADYVAQAVERSFAALAASGNTPQPAVEAGVPTASDAPVKRQRLPSMVEADIDPALYDEEDEAKTEVMAMSRVVAAIQGLRPDQANDPAAVKAALDGASRNKPPASPVSTAPSASGSQPPAPLNSRPPAASLSSRPPPSLSSRPPAADAPGKGSQALAAAADRLKSAAKSEAPPSGPVPVTSDRFLPLSLDESGGRRRPLTELANEPPAPAPLTAAVHKRPNRWIVPLLLFVIVLSSLLIVIRLGLLPSVAKHLPPALVGESR